MGSPVWVRVSLGPVPPRGTPTQLVEGKSTPGKDGRKIGGRTPWTITTPRPHLGHTKDSPSNTTRTGLHKCRSSRVVPGHPTPPLYHLVTLHGAPGERNLGRNKVLDDEPGRSPKTPTSSLNPVSDSSGGWDSGWTFCKNYMTGTTRPECR